jgi:coenzyme F420-dependent glucose-6-phosphate dehydrogenase
MGLRACGKPHAARPAGQERGLPTPRMTRFSYHVSHEQHSPRDLLHYVQLAEAAGFDAAFSSDHLQPWGPAQGQSGHTWAWLGAALQATQRLRFSAITVPGGWRYHPVVLAQAIATLALMYPGRVPWVALGSGEALNEACIGSGWPAKPERQQRLQKAALAMHALMAGERVSQPGPVPIDGARLWTRPRTPVPLVGAATSVETARWVGGWADGLLTVAPRFEDLQAIVRAFREGGGHGKPVHVKVDVCWAPSDEEALLGAHAQWRYNAAPGDAAEDAREPEDFDRLTRHLSPEDMRQHVFISHDLEAHFAHLRQWASVGAATLDIHQVGGDQVGFIRQFGERVLPALRLAGGSAP